MKSTILLLALCLTEFMKLFKQPQFVILAALLLGVASGACQSVTQPVKPTPAAPTHLFMVPLPSPNNPTNPVTAFNFFEATTNGPILLLRAQMFQSTNMYVSVAFPPGNTNNRYFYCEYTNPPSASIPGGLGGEASQYSILVQTNGLATVPADAGTALPQAVTILIQ